jgi:hypothetical protein
VGGTVVNAEVITSLSRFLRQFENLHTSGIGKLQYRLNGTAFVESSGSCKLPFDEKREIELNVSPAGEKGTKRGKDE